MTSARVLHLRSSCGLYGAEQVILSLAAHQPRFGFEPIVSDLRLPGDEGPFLQTARRQGQRVAALGCRGRFDRRVVEAVRRLVRAEQVAVIHTHDYKASFYGYLAARSLPVALVATCHGWDRTGLRLAAYRMIDTWMLRRFPEVVAVAGPVAEDLRRRGIPESRLSIIPNGINVGPEETPLSPGDREALRRELGLPAGDLIVGTVGRLEHAKGYDVLLTAFAQLRRLRSDLHLLIVGDGSLRALLPALARELKVEGAVSFAGQRDDVPRLLGLFSVFVSSSRREGMPMAVLEAAAARLPIVATRVGEVPSVVEHGVTGWLVPPADPRALCEAVAEALQDPAHASARGDAAAARVRARFTASACAERTCQVYRRALSLTSSRGEPVHG